MTQSVAFIGLGAMGYRMAAHLPKYFEKVYVWNRNFSKAEQHATEYGTTAVELTQAVQADVIFSCLPTSEDVEALIDGLEIKSGSIWIDCTSGVPEAARRLAEKLKAQNVDFLDAPVSGQTVGAENATLTVMVGGDVDAFERAYPAMAAVGKLIQHVGESGAGFAVKAINNMLLAVNLWSVAEGFSTLKAHGVNLDAALNCINASSGKSLVTETIFPQRVLSREFSVTFGLPLLAKDTGIALDLVKDAKLPAPILSLTQSLIQAANLTAEPNSDFSAAVKMYESWTKITLK
ncbi:3-hydroxyisobutyrate dehydrogenase [Acinetobacter gyllenbergii]|uniref:3-hydroxyisobutyrate dehydrogenase n=1 Tax=Acinetobacter gyllenbergii CIP 110306 = MTCC 11365 TaxID=1217657 RepID=A0A829HJ12_9GAMM|nr:NAD(P)-dependent oxidoreductase [Acinetobacter gyllenbergii]EPF88052.1 3-hydroxyisobutyrate dehydrogenase [Acinetobacter gyllenbergii CIP 110306 = MTCC 11365]EPH35872.1 3-hydroxyisobutyrate dehydrogenase [Acinetobacter gyllenbergii CIP 110306 = MTCC 11365]GMA12446.1 3-hydroxyisobutyrate dehydrogenase [Acinetobacter gyllenbergii]